jgi:hypothetical protein
MTDPTEPLERVARAIAATKCHENGIEFEQILFGKDIDAIARAAIAAYESALSARIAALEEALTNAVLQIEYLHEKFQETGSGNAVVIRARVVLEGNKP